MPAQPSAHAIFVHGLEGDATATWLSSTAPKEFWPGWLAEDIPDLAVWSLGYEATWTWWKKGGALALPDRAASVVPILAHQRELQSGNIYFVTHSLGGLVVESVLRHAEMRAPYSSQIDGFLQRVRKVAFLGTPHRGSDLASFANSIRLLRSRQTTAGLSRNDPHLIDLNLWYRHFADQHHIQGLVLRETKPIRAFGLIVVKADSADPGLSPETEIIPIDADHFTIVKPRGRDDVVYKHLLRFLSQPVTGQPRGVAIVDAVRDVEKAVAISESRLSADIQDNTQSILDAIGQVGSARIASVRESSVVTTELEQRLWRLRKSRFIANFDLYGEVDRLVRSVAPGGELESASRPTKSLALAWCARLLSTTAPDEARAALAEAKLNGTGEAIAIGAAFIDGIGESDVAGGLAHINGSDTPEAKTASFVISVAGKTPTEALQWLSDSGFSLDSMDSDGRFVALQRRLDLREVDRALTDATVLTETDFDQTPVLLHLMAVLHLCAAVHPEFRDGILNQLPIGLENFPLNSTPEALEHRRLAQVYFGRAKVAFYTLEQVRAADVCADYELWLALRNSDTHAAALRTLQESKIGRAHV